ncbi:MAG: hypothetical protein ACKO3H_06445 [Verrucomicrobiota bacterium]
MAKIEGNPVGRFKTPGEGSLLPGYPSGDAIVGSFSGNPGGIRQTNRPQRNASVHHGTLNRLFQWNLSTKRHGPWCEFPRRELKLGRDGP